MSRTKQIKQIKINLDEYRAGSNPGILTAYKQANAMDLYVGGDSPAVRNEERVYAAARASKKAIRHVITGIYRQRVNNNEYVFFHEELTAFDYFSNVITHNRLVGRFDRPVITKTFGISPGMIKGNTDMNDLMEKTEKQVEIDHNETVWEFPFEQMRDQLEQWKKESVITDQTKLYIWNNNKKYSKPFSWREWMDLSVDDLVLLANFSDKLSTAFKTDEITQAMIDTLRKTLREELLTVPAVKTGATQ